MSWASCTMRSSIRMVAPPVRAKANPSRLSRGSRTARGSTDSSSVAPSAQAIAPTIGSTAQPRWMSAKNASATPSADDWVTATVTNTIRRSTTYTPRKPSVVPAISAHSTGSRNSPQASTNPPSWGQRPSPVIPRGRRCHFRCPRCRPRRTAAGRWGGRTPPPAPPTRARPSSRSRYSTWSANRRTSPSRWVITTTARPRSWLSRRSSANVRCSATASMAAVGSSRNATCAPAASTRASSTWPAGPPDRSRTKAPRWPSACGRLQRPLGDAGRGRREPGRKKLQPLQAAPGDHVPRPHRHRAVQRRRLRHVRQCGAGSARPHVAADRRQEPQQRLEEGALARAVAPQHRQQRARADRQVDGRQQRAAAVPDHQPLAAKQGRPRLVRRISGHVFGLDHETDAVGAGGGAAEGDGVRPHAGLVFVPGLQLGAGARLLDLRGGSARRRSGSSPSAARRRSGTPAGGRPCSSGSAPCRSCRRCPRPAG